MVIKMITIDKELIKDIVLKGNRIDGRKFDEYRKIKVETGVIEKAEGSARVELGETKVVAGVKLELGEPFPDTPNQGVLIVSSEFVPIASPLFESGPPSELSIELSRVVDRTIREAKAIDLEKLVVSENKVWMIFIDIIIIDHDGNLIDASELASMIALLNAKIPNIIKGEKEIKIDTETKGTEPLPIVRRPVTITVAKISNNLIIDPNFVEENAVDARLSVGSYEENGSIYLCSMQKGGTTGFSREEIEKAIDLVAEKQRGLREVIQSAINN